jgi:hypothetical protein
VITAPVIYHVIYRGNPLKRVISDCHICPINASIS